MMLAALLMSMAAPEVPAVDPETFDFRCFIAFAQVLDGGDPAIRAAGIGPAIFYFGRIDARMGVAEMEARLSSEALAMEGSDIPALIRTCSEFMQERGRVLTEIGGRLTAREQARQTR